MNSPAPAATGLTPAPYPGLRPFRREESDIFFGRDRQIDALLERLQRQRFIAVTGPSGCGKSSLIKAGVIPALRTGLMAEAGSRWRVCEMRPGLSPIRALATALAVPEILGPVEGASGSPAYVEAALRYGPRGLAQIVGESPVLREASMFLLVDQFEEIFRYRDHIDPDEADAFVALLLTAAAQAGLRLYIVITMRSEYLGKCTVFHGLPEAISDSQYLTPRLTRDECAQAIRGPARVFDGDVDAALINRLLNDFGPDPDQLPLLQHALLRMWLARRGVAPAEGAKGSASPTLTVADYEALHGLGNALSNHADEVLHALAPAQQKIAERLFKRLSERSRDNPDTRAPATLDEVCGIAGVSLDEARPVVEAFRAEGCNFIVAADDPLEPDTLLDIGHESLIRQWKTMAGWVEEEAASADVFRWVLESARRFHGPGGGTHLWGADLERAQRWRHEHQPNARWAARYSASGFHEGRCADHDLAMAHIDESQRAWDDRQRERRLDAERGSAREAEVARRRSLFQRALGALVVIGVLAAALVVNEARQNWKTTQLYANYGFVLGVPHGMGVPLATSEAARRAGSFEITTRGWFDRKRVVAMRFVDGQGRFAFASLEDPSGLPQPDLPTQRDTVEWRFVYDQNGRLVTAQELDRKGHQISERYYSIPAGDAKVTRSTSHGLGREGFPKPLVAGTCAIATTSVYDPRGYEIEVHYKDRWNRPATGRDQAFAQKRVFDDEGRELEFTSLDAQGRPMNDIAGNATLKISDFDRFGNPRLLDSVDKDGRRVVFKDGFAIRRFTYDEVGNMLEVRLFDAEDRPTTHEEGWHRTTFAYDTQGFMTGKSFWSRAGTAVTSAEGCHRLEWTSDARGRTVEGACFGVDGKPQRIRNGTERWHVEYDDDDNIIAWSNFDGAGKPALSDMNVHRVETAFDARGNPIEYRYFDQHRKPTPHAKFQFSFQQEFDAADRVTRLRYFAKDGWPTAGEGGYADIRYEYDLDGRLLHERYFDAEALPVRLEDGEAGVDFKYDECGRESLRTYVGPDGSPVLVRQGYASLVTRHDELGRQFGATYLGVDGAPTPHKEVGYASYEDTLDRLGRTIGRRYFDVVGKPVKDSEDGIFGFDDLLDDRGEVVERRYVAASGRPPQAGTYGEAGWRTRWSDGAKAGEMQWTLEFFDANGKPCLGGKPPDRFARHLRTWDSNRTLIDDAYFGLNGERLERPATTPKP